MKEEEEAKTLGILSLEEKNFKSETNCIDSDGAMALFVLLSREGEPLKCTRQTFLTPADLRFLTEIQKHVASTGVDMPGDC